MSTVSSESSTDEQLKQDLDEDLSQLVQNYEHQGLSANEIVDSMIWHAEVAVSRSQGDVSVDEYTSE